ncbi:hypothetical protein HPB52_009511 [Rhipicephalus sanguineus]|uniref:C2H2-type domain-containing protein n=1 Tax=Rhipicephalus sanguineus TaxID=34632 RepID=A0A9D4SNA6_RHISA|nr:hypothetical protein HPB52_009511 [Rhipicephalus sanguineus]
MVEINKSTRHPLPFAGAALRDGDRDCGWGRLGGRMPTSQGFLGTSAVNLESAASAERWHERGILQAPDEDKQTQVTLEEAERRAVTSHDVKPMQARPRRSRHGSVPWSRTTAAAFAGRLSAVSSNLKRHGATHTGKKPYACLCCPATFALKWSLENHVLTHTGAKKHGCPTCGRMFARKQYVARHLRLHTGEKPFTCRLCPAEFAHQTTLEQHLFTHTDEKPYRCEECGRRFAQRASLFRHNYVHTREKHYACDRCPAAFSHKKRGRRPGPSHRSATTCKAMSESCKEQSPRNSMKTRAD